MAQKSGLIFYADDYIISWYCAHVLQVFHGAIEGNSTFFSYSSKYGLIFHSGGKTKPIKLHDN